MAEPLAILRLTHVVIGCVGLVMFWIPMFARKGGRLHKRAGRLFAMCALYAGGTGLVMSVWALVHPPSFFGDPQMTDIAPNELPIALANARFLYSITGFLAIAVLWSVVFGVALARTHRDPARLARPAVIALLSVYGLWSLGLLVYGAWSMLHVRGGDPALTESGGGRYWVTIVLGAVGLMGAFSDGKHLRRPPESPMGWLYKHMECVLGAGVGFHAAALFFGVNLWSGLDLQGAARFIPMLIPFIVGVPAMWWWIARMERRLEGGGPSSPN